MAKPDLWDDPETAVKKQKKLAELKEEVNTVSNFREKKEEIKEILGELGEDNDLLKEVSDKVRELKREIGKKEFRVFLSGKYDKKGAILEISSGVGGRDAEDFVAMLLRMYERYVERKGYQKKIVYASYGDAGGPEGRVGIKSVSLEINGAYAFGFLKEESGTHRLVRKSPFSSGGVRHTSFAQVDVFPKIGEKDTDVKIKEEDIRVDVFRASGPGGQHVNKRETAVRVTHLPTKVVAASQSERLQGENRRISINIIKSKLQQMKEKEKKEEAERAKGEGFGSSWGTQIRNYVLHPYKLIKDLRTQKETSNVEEVLDGDLDIIKNDFL